jgi:hypothetical protein
MEPWMLKVLDVLGVLGWVALLAGFSMQRKALMNANVVNRVSGSQNTVTNNIHQTHSAAPGEPHESRLAKSASWATLVGLALTLWPLVKPWLAVAH